MAVVIYDYIHYRGYLADWFEQPGTPSQKEFSGLVGISPALVSSIRGGNRDLDLTAIAKWSRHMGHDDDEARYFAALVESESPSRMHRAIAVAYVRAVRRFRAAEKVTDERLAVYTVWYCAAILELARCEGFQGDPEWIAERLVPPVTVPQARDGLDTLLANGLLVREGERFIPKDEVVATDLEIPRGMVSAAILEYLLGMLSRAEATLERATPARERHFTTLMVALPESALPHLKRRMAELEQELIDFCAASDERDRVYQLAFLLFPVSRSTR